jgi:hypothetical protein
MSTKFQGIDEVDSIMLSEVGIETVKELSRNNDAVIRDYGI